MGKVALLVLVVIMALMMVGALATTHEAPADFTYVNSSGIHTLDPARMSWTTDFRVALNLWEGLTTWDPVSLEPIPAAAELPPAVSPDGRTLTFTVRDDARWSNGDPVLAADFVRGWRRGLEPGTSTDYAFLIADHIQGAEEYYRWRLDNVTVLTALARIRDGWEIDARQAKALVDSELGDMFLPEGAGKGGPADTDWNQVARDISASGRDLAGVYDKAFEQHANAMDDRFEQVAIRTQGDRKLVVTLREPCAYFLDLTGFPIFLPCHPSVEIMRNRYRGRGITAEGLVVYDAQWTKPRVRRNGYPGLITNGAYRLSDWVFKRRARLEVNDFYRRARSMECRIVDMLVYDNLSAALMAYEADRVDFLPDLGVPYEHELVRLAQTGQRPDIHLASVLATYFLNFNCQSDQVNGRRNPFVDARVRKAFTLAVDRPQLVERVLGRGDEVARTFVPPGTMEAYRSPAGLEADVVAARKLLADAGYPNGAALPPIELLYTPNDELLCQAIGHMWETQLNVDVELRSLESKAFAERKAGREYMVARGNWFADYRDPTTFLDCLKTGNGNNDCGYSSENYDRLLDQARKERHVNKRADILARAEEIIVDEDCPILPILHYRSPIAIKPRVKGLYANRRLWFPFWTISF
ncbi:MAG: peptide ABC transporter substrate-binding protein [Planctomycetota bacterium]|jgi:oligopeptide transport system substrate-binding protein